MKQQNSIDSNQKVELNWYIFYTHPRAEKIAYENLLEKGYNVFLPLKKEVHKWNNRQKKTVELPLFPNYLFVNTEVHNIYYISKSEKISMCIKCGSEPSIVKDAEMHLIRKMVDLDQDVIVNAKLTSGRRVRIINGPLMGFEGILTKQRGKYCFGIQLKDINQSICIDVDVRNLIEI